MKQCPQCLKLYEDVEDQILSPAEDLAEIFLGNNNQEIDIGICPECREQRGFTFLLGFDQ